MKEGSKSSPETIVLDAWAVLAWLQGEQEAQDAIDEVQQAPIEVISISNTLVFQAARIKMRRAISYADAFAVATAQTRRAKLLSGDPELKKIKDVPILWVG